MESTFKDLACQINLRAARAAVLALCAGLVLLSSEAEAQSPGVRAQEPLVVRNDRGGELLKRIEKLNQLRSARRPVEIRGGICYSTCTLYLGLPNTCVSPNTTFGFHGPSSYGQALDPATFNRASEVIASHYPARLREWYMETGRFKIRSVYKIKGRNIIKMGVRAC